VVEDPWLLAVELFAPCYIGGWSAAEHWGLTEQLFRSTFVVSAAPLRKTEHNIAGVGFHVVTVPVRRVESVPDIWHGRERVRVSTPERTIADGLVSPTWVGGIRQLAEMLTAYRQSKAWKPDRLLDEVSTIGTGAAFKRFGFLLEALHLDEPRLIKAALNRRTSGLVKLDPAIKTKGRLVKRWGLWLNASIEEPA
jgi:predicted transcriptional regulator of viral defense system